MGRGHIITSIKTEKAASKLVGMLGPLPAVPAVPRLSSSSSTLCVSRGPGTTADCAGRQIGISTERRSSVLPSKCPSKQRLRQVIRPVDREHDTANIVFAER